MNTINRLNFLLSDILINEPSTSSNEMSQDTPLESSTKQTVSQCDPYPSPLLSSSNVTKVPLLPRRNSSLTKHCRQRHRIDQSNNQKQDQPLLNSSTLDDLFRALTLECERYIASAAVATTSSYQNKDCDKTIVSSPTKIQTAIESNDDDYENLHTSTFSQPITNFCAPLKTSIEVISPIKRHIVSITITSKISSPQSISPEKPSCNTAALVITPTICHSSEDDSVKMSSSSTNRKRRRRARKQILSSSITRSSSSSNERKEIINNDKRPTISKRSYSTDPLYQRNRNLYHNDFISYSSSQKQRTKRPYRRDVSLQHSFLIPECNQKNHSLPLTVLLTSTKGTSDFLDNSHRQQQQRRSRRESVYHKTSALPNRMHQNLYCPLPTRNNHAKNKIPTHHIPSYPVY